MEMIYWQLATDGHALGGWSGGVPGMLDAASDLPRNYGGPVEYLVVALLALHIAIGRPYLRAWRARWPRAVFASAMTVLGLLWVTTLTAVWMNWSGDMYSSNRVPVVARTVIVAIGYFWIVPSSLAALAMLAGRLPIAKASARHSPARRRWLGAAGIVAFSAPVAAAAFGTLVERNRYRILEQDLPVTGLHPDLEGFRIAQVSDLHISPFLSVREAARVIDMANELRPDLALFTGDLISELGDPLDAAIRELVRLRADHGVLGCMGNHEQYVGCRDYLEHEAGRAGLVFLRDAATQIRRGQGVLNIAGVDYQRKNAQASYLRGTERFIVPGAANILLSHNPDVFPTAIRRGFTAVLSGHTHGGQINVEILHRNVNPARFRTPFTSGLYRQEGVSCFVTNGIGTIGMPIRLGAPPEIALLRLRRA